MSTSATFSARLTQMEQDTGLNAQQLGVTRVYDRPHVSTSSTEHQAPLTGEEILIKDLQQVAGEVTSFGSQEQERASIHDDSTARRLLDLGVTLVGASATSEFGVTAYTEPIGQDAPINPLNPQLTPGGSSGGAAVAVARGLVNIAHATDGGGSIRIPAACNGIPGLKPAHDSTLGGFTPTAHGFLAADFETTARAYQLKIPDLSAQVKQGRTPLRIGYTNTPFHSLTCVDPAIAAATAATTALLTTSVAVESVSQAPAPYAPRKFDLFREVLTTRCANLPGSLSPITRWLKEQGQMVPSWRRKEIHNELHALRDQILSNWPDADVIVTPMLACAPPAPGTFSSMPPRLNFLAQTAWTPWATLWNITGWASLSVPLVAPEKVPGRWPIAIQLGAISNRASAADLLALGQLIQQISTMLPPEDLSLSPPGDMDSLSFRPSPTPHHHGHDHD